VYRERNDLDVRNDQDQSIRANSPQWLRRLPTAVRVALLVALYLISWYALDLIALRFESAPEIQIWYPPSALDVVLLLVFGMRFAPALLLNTFVHDWFVTGRHLPLGTLIIFDLTTTLGYTVACALLLRKLRINPRLRRLRDVVWFTIIAALIAPLVIALLQATNFAAIGLIPWSDWLISTLNYWAGDSTGIGMLAPLLLVLLRKVPWVWAYKETRSQQAFADTHELRLPSWRGLPLLLFHIALLALGIWAALGAPRGAKLDYTYLVFLPLIWVAVQFGLPRAVLSVLGINIGAALLVGTSTGVANTLALQFGLMATTHVGILLGAVSTERQRTEAKLRQAYRKVQAFNHKLERQVRERTAQIQEQMEQLQQMGQLKDDFLSTVSHELRSPLANMTLAIHMLQLATSQERRDRYLQILQAECARETALINDLLDLQRLEAGVDAIELQALQLQEWLPLVVEAFRERAQSHQQTLQLDIAPNLPPLISDPLGLERVVTELITNACKYTPSGGAIIVTVCATSATPAIAPDRVVLTVCNSGVEISAADLTRVFEKFYRIPNSDRWQRGGTGLGLALVQKLVEQLGGEIRVESQTMQTVFIVELPTGTAGEGTP